MMKTEVEDNKKRINVSLVRLNGNQFLDDRIAGCNLNKWGDIAMLEKIRWVSAWFIRHC